MICRIKTVTDSQSTRRFYTFTFLFDEAINSLIELLQCLLIIIADSIDNTMLKMVLEYDATDSLDGAINSGKLYEHFAAVSSVLYHVLNGFEMTNEPRHAVEHCFCLRMAVCMTMRMLYYCTIWQHMCM